MTVLSGVGAVAEEVSEALSEEFREVLLKDELKLDDVLVVADAFDETTTGAGVAAFVEIAEEACTACIP